MGVENGEENNPDPLSSNETDAVICEKTGTTTCAFEDILHLTGQTPSGSAERVPPKGFIELVASGKRAGRLDSSDRALIAYAEENACGKCTLKKT